jgi:GT2 family glycosyltransferase
MTRADAPLAVGEDLTEGDHRWPDVSVVLLTQHPGDWEVETAAIVRSQQYRGAIILVVIDSSPDYTSAGSRALREAADRWEAVSPQDFGHARTRNRAVELVTTPVVVYLSSDAHPVNDRWLERLVKPLAEGRAQASYGRQVAPRRDAERETTYDYLYPQDPELKSKARIQELGIRTFHFSDVTSAFLTDVLRRVRFPDELAIFEDVGVAKRLLDADHQIAYVPDAAVLHVHELGLRELARRYRRIGAVYEHVGVFAELRKHGRMPYLREGVRTTRAVTPNGGRGPLAPLQSLLVGGLKLAAVTYGRMQTRLNVGDVV